MHVLICGGGVIGCSIAYFLSRRGVKATVIEGTGLACAASGKSGGFLARDWCDGSPLSALARRSFDLHARLAPFKRIRRIELVTELPKTISGKIRRVQLRRLEHDNNRDDVLRGQEFREEDFPELQKIRSDGS